jgi:hypothetical protein
MKETPDMEPECKGSWSLGTACGKCKRCADEALELMPRMMSLYKRARDAGVFLDALAIAYASRESLNPVLVAEIARQHADALNIR